MGVNVWQKVGVVGGRHSSCVRIHIVRLNHKETQLMN